MNLERDEFYMSKALALAQRAFDALEVPIGCVIVQNDEIVGEGFNLRNSMKNTLYHAEILAINQASRRIGDWRLEDCCIYVTVEPCPMCAGAILQARLPRLVYGAASPKAGAAGSVVNLLSNPGFNHRVEVAADVLGAECAGLVSRFFREVRAQLPNEN